MHLPASPHHRLGAGRLGFGPLALALMLTTTFPLSHARADEAPATPPSFPDAAHVVNGCYISSAAYLAKFLAAFPAEKAQPLDVTMRNRDGRTRPHTIVLLTWRGEWWGRDEHFGVFTLRRLVGDGKVSERVRQTAEGRLEEHAHRLVAAGRGERALVTPERMNASERAAAVATARELVPVATKIFWADCGREEIPLLFFRPAAGAIAVYDAVHGTARAECGMTDDAAIVALAAKMLGYKVATVRAGFIGATVASANSTVGGLAP